MLKSHGNRSASATTALLRAHQVTTRTALQSILLITLVAPTQVLANTDKFSLESKPVWEAGLGAGYFNGTDYPGSKDPNIAQFGLPFFIYRSKIFRIGDGGAGAVAFEEPRLKIDVSFGGSLNAEPETDSVRSGMPDLDLLFEIGPRLQYKLFKQTWSNGSSTEVSIESKLRAVFETDFSFVRAQGFVFGAGTELRQRRVIANVIDLLISADITFADKRYNNNLYSVPAEFVTANRAEYSAKAGYVDTSVFLGMALRPTPDWRIFTGVSFGNFAGAANRDSPLFETTSSAQFAIGLVWTALKSKRRIDVYTSE